MQPATSYGAYPGETYTDPGSYSEPPPVLDYEPPPISTYEQGYRQPDYMPPPPRQQPNYGYVPPLRNPPPGYQAGQVNVNVYNTLTPAPKNNNALVVEVIASLFGIYGIGWLMAGETTTGILLLVGSFVLYWPIFILGTLFTLGIGLLCLIPLAIAAIIVNTILLNNRLNRRTANVTVVVPPPPQQMRMPPQ